MIYCLFEQSGTFRDVFRSRGLDAIDVDIEDKFGETDVQIDLFAAIEKLPNGFLGSITSYDKIIAFFPCTWFCDYNDLIFSRKWRNFEKMSDEQINAYIENRKRERLRALNCFLHLIMHCKHYKIPLIIENPVGHYLRPYKPSVVHCRDVYGDFYRKPTMYFTYNCKINEKKMQRIRAEQRKVEKNRGIQRSLMSPIYARNLINAIEWS